MVCFEVLFSFQLDMAFEILILGELERPHFNFGTINIMNLETAQSCTKLVEAIGFTCHLE